MFCGASEIFIEIVMVSTSHNSKARRDTFGLTGECGEFRLSMRCLT